MDAQATVGNRLRATLIKLPDSTPGLLVVAGEQKAFVLEGIWRAAAPPAAGMQLEVELAPDGSVASIYALDAQQLVRERGQQVAQLSLKTFELVLARYGKVTLGATLALWIGWFFLPALDLGLAKLTFWEALGIDTSNMFALLSGSRPGFMSFLGLVVITAPLAVPFLKSPRASWLYAAPLGFVLLVLSKTALSLGAASRTGSAAEGAFGEAMRSMEAAAQQAMLESALNALAWGLGVVVLASGVLAVQALKHQAPVVAGVGTRALGTWANTKAIDRRVLWGIGGSVAALAIAVWGASLLYGLLKSPEARQEALFDELNETIASAGSDCSRLGPALRRFFDDHESDFELLTRLSPEDQARVGGAFVERMTAAQLTIGSRFMLCSSQPDFMVAVQVWQTRFGQVHEGFARSSRLAAPAPAPRPESLEAAPAAKPSLWERLFGTKKDEPAAAPPASLPRAQAAIPALPVVAPSPVPAAPPEPTPPPAAASLAEVAAATPPAAAALAPAQTATAFAVFDVLGNDVLHARREPNPGAPSVFGLPPATSGLLGGEVSGPAGNQWVKVRWSARSGWVSRAFLAEQRGDACRDGDVSRFAQSVIDALRSADGGALSSLVSPLHGLQVRMDIAAPSTRIKQPDVASLFASREMKRWGSALTGSFRDVVQPTLAGSLTVAAPEGCGRIAQPRSSNKPASWPVELVALLPFTVGPLSGDSTTWVLGIEFVAGRPQLAALVQYAPSTPAAPPSPPGAAAVKEAPAPTAKLTVAKAAAAKALAKPEAAPAIAEADPASKRRRKRRSE